MNFILGAVVLFVGILLGLGIYSMILDKKGN